MIQSRSVMAEEVSQRAVWRDDGEFGRVPTKFAFFLSIVLFSLKTAFRLSPAACEALAQTFPSVCQPSALASGEFWMALSAHCSLSSQTSRLDARPEASAYG